MSQTASLEVRSKTTDGHNFERFCNQYIKHVSGPWAGQPFTLEQWQADWVNELLEKEDGQRVNQFGLLGIGRGNGKSALASALALYFLFVDGLYSPGAEVYSAAGSKEQARIVFSEAKRFLEASPALFNYARLYRDAIEVPQTGAIFRVLPAGQPQKLHGLKPSAYIIDEVHAVEDFELIYALQTAQAKRPGSIGIGISTAGFNLDSPLGALYQRGKNGEPGFYLKWFQASDPDDVGTYKEANPASWLTQATIERECKRVPPAVAKRLFGNVWTRAVEQWLPSGAWKACESSETIEPGASLFVGLDLGFSEDHSAVVEVQCKNDRYICRSTIFASHPDPSKPAPLAHKVFDQEKQSHRAVVDHILSISKRNPITELVYDPYGATLLIEELEEQGLLCVEFPQTNARMTKATDILYGLITNEKLAHDGDKAFAAHIDACTVKFAGDGLRLWKTPDRQPMDSGIALAIAIQRAHTVGSNEFHFYPL